MGNCLISKKSQYSNVDIEQVSTNLTNKTPSEWNQQDVAQWFQTLDLSQHHLEKLMKRVKKSKLNGKKLMSLTDETVKQTLKVGGNDVIGLRLELMKAINKLKSTENYPSPLLKGDDQYPSLPQYYPFDYNYRVNQQSNTNDNKLNNNKKYDNDANDDRKNNNNNNNHIFSRDDRRKLLAQTTNIRRNGGGYHLPALSKPNTNHNNNRISKHIIDRLSWTVGTVVLVYCPNYAIWCAGTIESVGRSGGLSNGQYLYGMDDCLQNLGGNTDETVTVAYDVGIGRIVRKTLSRFDEKNIKSDDRFLKNRYKLTKSCMIEVFDDMTQQWTCSYIKAFGRNHDEFIIEKIYNKGNDLRYNRWSPKIRCYESLLNLTINSELHVFINCDIGDYCCAKIVDIFNYDADDGDHRLSIFKVIYKTEDNQYFYKYIHQFSANILLLNNDDQRPSDYTLLEVAIHSNHLTQSCSQIKHDRIDQQYTDLLLQGWLRANHVNNNYFLDSVNLLSMLMNRDDYIGPNYQLIMYLENKFWSRSS